MVIEMDKIISLKDISFKYENNYIFQNVSFNVNRGDIFGISGANGTGKSTLLNIIGGYLPGYEGHISYETDRYSMGSMVGGASIYEDMTVADNIRMVNRMHKGKKAFVDERLYEITGLMRYEKKRASKLSLGNKQMLALSMTAGSELQLLLMDEPFNGIDPVHKTLIIKYLKKRAEEGLTIIMTSHIKGDLSLMCNEIYNMGE